MFKKLVNHFVKNSKSFLNLKEEVALIGQYFEEHPPRQTVGSGAVFYVPAFWQDHIQREIFTTKNYFDLAELGKLDRYIPDNATIIDIGANIGNHSIYWSIERGARLVHAFEPVRDTFELLARNIAENGLQDRVVLHNCGISSKSGMASASSVNRRNVGATQLKPDDSGTIPLVALDDVEIDADTINLIKIDVEGFELEALAGARNTIEKYSPVLSVEAAGENLNKVDAFLAKLGYRREETVGWCTYVYSRAQ